MICARCLKTAEAPRRKSRVLSMMIRTFQVLAGVMVLWLAFFLLGRTLLKLPSTFHEGTIWDTTGADR